MRCLNIGVLQSSAGTDYETNLNLIEARLDKIMMQMNRPELVVGVEYAIGLHDKNGGYDTIPGNCTCRLSSMAKKYHIYFIPGTMYERKYYNGREQIFNAMPIFNPDGELIHVYRKICPYYPMENILTPGEEYIVLHIKEKDIKIGVMICHDWCFPEISRNLTLLGSEMLLRIAMDPEGLYENCKHIAEVRAFENQSYFVSLNMAGEFGGTYTYGKSAIAGPDGRLIYEAGNVETSVSITLDFDEVSKTRIFGTNFTDQLLRQLKLFKFPATFEADDIGNSPLLRNLPNPDKEIKERSDYFRTNKLMHLT